MDKETLRKIFRPVHDEVLRKKADINSLEEQVINDIWSNSIHQAENTFRQLKEKKDELIEYMYYYILNLERSIDL